MPIRVLLADDHAIFRSGLRALLEKERDIEIVGETGDGLETIRAVERLCPDVLLLDLGMPGVGGTKVAETIASEKKRVRILVLTMHEDEYYVRELFKAGVRGYLLKRSSGEELVKAIRKVHAGGRYVDPALAGNVISSLLGTKETPEEGGKLARLTKREREVCKLLAYGHTNAEIAERLCVSVRTVESHRASIMTKLELGSRAELVRFAIDSGLLKLE